MQVFITEINIYMLKTFKRGLESHSWRHLSWNNRMECGEIYKWNEEERAGLKGWVIIDAPQSCIPCVFPSMGLYIDARCVESPMPCIVIFTPQIQVHHFMECMYTALVAQND